MQLSLFPSFHLVPAPRPCSCGCATAVLGSSRGPHAGELVCANCAKHLMWASHALVAETRGFVTGISSFNPGTRP